MAEQAWLDQKARHSPKVLDCPKPGVRSPRRLLRPRRPLSPAEALKPVLGACSGRLCPLFQVVLGTGENQSSTKRSVGPPLQLSLHHPRKKKMLLQAFQSTLLSEKVGGGATPEPPHLPLRGSVCARSGRSAEPRFPLSAVFPAHARTPHSNPLSSFP